MAYFGQSGMAPPPQGGNQFGQAGGGGGMGGPRSAGPQTSPQGGGGQGPQPYQNLNRFSGLQHGQEQFQQGQAALMKMQQRCAQGDGSACIQAKQLQQRVQQQGMQHQQQVGMAQQAGQGGGMMGSGYGGGGRGGNNMQGMGAAMVGAQYGIPGFGGGMG